MGKAFRVTLTKSQADSSQGQQLIHAILDICHDGDVSIAELEALDRLLKAFPDEMNAIRFLREIVSESLADGNLSPVEALALKKAFARVVPKDVRGIVLTHLDQIGLPTFDADNMDLVSLEWTEHPATEAQAKYIRDLGGVFVPGMTKGEAAATIDALLDRRPPTPRQMMLLRFFDRQDLGSRTKDDVSEWVDELYHARPEYERAWQRFKRATGQDPRSRDFDQVPIGAYKWYLDSAPATAGSARQPAGCAIVVMLMIGAICGAFAIA